MIGPGCLANQIPRIRAVVWQAPETLERSRQDRWRAVFIWSAFALLVAAALGAQAFVARSLEIELGPREQQGRLSVQMPAEWRVSHDGDATLVASSPPGLQEQALTVSLLEAGEETSLLEVVSVGFDADAREHLETAARRVGIEGQPALLVEGSFVDPMRRTDVQVVKLAFRPAPRTLALVQLVVRGGPNSAAEVVVQQVARTVRVESEE